MKEDPPGGSRVSQKPVLRALQGLEIPRVPTGSLAVHSCAGFAGCSLREYTSNARALADSAIRYSGSASCCTPPRRTKKWTWPLLAGISWSSCRNGRRKAAQCPPMRWTARNFTTASRPARWATQQERGVCVAAMAEAAHRWLAPLAESGRIQGVIALGGGEGPSARHCDAGLPGHGELRRTADGPDTIPRAPILPAQSAGDPDADDDALPPGPDRH